MKENKLFNKQIDAQIKDIKHLKRDLSDKSCQLLDSQTIADKQVIEIEQLKSTLPDANFHFTKFKGTSEVVENLINRQLEFKHNNKKGLGYNAAPPPYNHNYFSFPITKEGEEMEKTMVYGKQPLSNFVEAGFEKPVDKVKSMMNDTNVSTSCAETVLIKGLDRGG